MTQPPKPERDPVTAEASGSAPEPEMSRPAPMDRFRTLTRRLLSVPREEVAEAEAKHREEATTRRKERS